jgi:hypothetical protein
MEDESVKSGSCSGRLDTQMMIFSSEQLPLNHIDHKHEFDTHQMHQINAPEIINITNLENKSTFKKLAAPCEIIQSRSISPKRSPPSLDLPSTG